MVEAIIFWIFSLMALAGAGILIFHKNPIHSALALIMTLFSTAALFVLLHAGFIAVLQVLVYAGAIMVLFVFVIMLLNLQREEWGLRHIAVKKAVAIVISVAIAVKFVTVVAFANVPRVPLPENFGSIEKVGMLMFTDFLLPFEAIAVVLLAAVVGAVVIAKTRI